MRGYYGIGIYNFKKDVNIGTLWRSAMCFGANFIFTIGKQYKYQRSDTCKTPLHVPVFHYNTILDLKQSIQTIPIIGIERTKKSIDITKFWHPERCMYLLGCETTGLPEEILYECNKVVHIDYKSEDICLNVAVAGSIALFHRKNQGGSK